MKMMNPTNTYLAICLGNKNSPRMKAWAAMPEAEQQAKMKEGMAGWAAWVEKNEASIVEMGGPLGKTKRVSPQGTEDISNMLSGYTIVRADSHEAAAKMFEKHPHFTLFPGEAVEIMPILAIPKG
jgi:hypothetical protein